MIKMLFFDEVIKERKVLETESSLENIRDNFIFRDLFQVMYKDY